MQANPCSLFSLVPCSVLVQSFCLIGDYGIVISCGHLFRLYAMLISHCLLLV